MSYQSIHQRQSKCPNCGTLGEAVANFCTECGTQIRLNKCSTCSTVNEADANFCTECGSQLQKIIRRVFKAIPNSIGTFYISGILATGYDYTIYENGTLIAELQFELLRKSGTLMIGGYTYKVYRESDLDTFIIERDGSIFARARKVNSFSRSFNIDYDKKQYTLKADSLVGRQFMLEVENQFIGKIYPDGMFTKKATIDLPEKLPVYIKLFIFWLVVMMWRQRAKNWPSYGPGN